MQGGGRGTRGPANPRRLHPAGALVLSNARPGQALEDELRPGTEMGRQTLAALYVALMAAVIVAVDLLFFKDRFWERLTANVGIVLVFVAFYFRFLRRP